LGELGGSNVVNAVVADESEDSPSMMQERERDRSRASADDQRKSPAGWSTLAFKSTLAFNEVRLVA
jgi:hypothetical protein